jgi:PAS domain S-box-containing protein
MLQRHALLARQLIFTVSAGFALALALIAALTLVGLSQLAENNTRLETIVQQNNVKTRLANQMRDILRDRAISMLSIVVMSEPFDKDREMMNFYAYGSAYQQVRQQLRDLARTAEEKQLLAQIDSITRSNQPVMVRVVDLGMGGYTFLAFEVLQQEALPMQRELVKQLDELIRLQREQTAQAARGAKTEYTRVRNLMILLGLLAIVSAGLVAWAVVRRTARLGAESERERTKFRTLFETNTDGIVILDPRGFTDCNAATLEMFHFAQREDFLGRRPEDLGTELQAGGLSARQLAESHIHQAMENGHAFFAWNARRPDGSQFPAEIALHAMTLDGQTVIQAIMRDVSPQKEAEAALKAARDTAISAAEMKSQFVANVSHEIRTPMNGILGMTRLLLGSPLDARQQDYANAISRSAEALMRMLNDLLDFSKIEAGHLHIERIDFDLNALLNDIIELYQPRTEAKGLGLRLDFPAELQGWVTGDPYRIRQILLNLTDNAIKFTHQGEVCLSVSRCADERLRLTISDTGIGMSEEVQARVFQAFAQGDGSISRRFGGTGLGLAICKQLATLMDGRLWLESRPGQGSRFHLELPLPCAQAQAASSDHGSRVRYPGARVLVAEDNSVNQKLVSYMLEELGIETLLADNGKAAWQMLAREKVDLVLMDCQMPEWDGLTATRAIREREASQALPRLPVIALTANVMSGYAETCRQAGMDDYLTKPLREDDLADALQR